MTGMSASRCRAEQHHPARSSAARPAPAPRPTSPASALRRDARWGTGAELIVNLQPTSPQLLWWTSQPQQLGYGSAPAPHTAGSRAPPPPQRPPWHADYRRLPLTFLPAGSLSPTRCSGTGAVERPAGSSVRAEPHRTVPRAAPHGAPAAAAAALPALRREGGPTCVRCTNRLRPPPSRAARKPGAVMAPGRALVWEVRESETLGREFWISGREGTKEP